jgi:hypothetical protein
MNRIYKKNQLKFNRVVAIYQVLSGNKNIILVEKHNSYISTIRGGGDSIS